MRAWIPIAVLVLVGCSPGQAPVTSSTPPMSEVAAARSVPTPLSATARQERCLPVVARACGCVYSCGAGTLRDDGKWDVTHAGWKGSTLVAAVTKWCVDGACTDVFDAEIVCDGICAPKPADPTCRFDADHACVGRQEP